MNRVRLLIAHTAPKPHRPRSRNRVIAVVAVALATLTTAACSPDAATPDSDPTSAETSSAIESPRRSDSTSEPAGTPARVATDLESPWSTAFYRGSALISERDSGRVLELPTTSNGTWGPRVVGTIEDSVHNGEGGLLGLAVREDELYVYTTTAQDNRIVRYQLIGNPGSLRLGDSDIVLDGIPAASYHNGGRLAFGPDGMLYATVGDAGDADTAQDLDTLGGKILRLTPDGGVPDDNPLENSPVYSYGHRNPQGLGWGADGTMYATEFGQDTWDELNIIEAGENYGWPIVEGIADDADFIDPVQQWAPEDASPSGMAVVGGNLFIANLRGEVLRIVPAADPTASTEYFAGEYGRLRDAVAGPGGSVWLLTNNTDGRGTPQPGDDHLMRIDITD